MLWLSIALIPPALFSVSNYLDKYLLSRYFKNTGASVLLIFSSLISAPVLALIFFIDPSVLFINSLYRVIITFNGALFIVSLIPYLYALKRDTASNVVPLFQAIPVFSYFLGFLFLGETLTVFQFFAAFIIVIGASLLSVQFSNKVTFRTEVFGLMMLSSFLISLNFSIFKYIAVHETFWATSFWEYTGFLLVGVILLLYPSKRKEFLKLFSDHRHAILGVNAFNEVINIVAKIIANFATLLAPLALVATLNGTQPFFILILGFIASAFFPKWFSEKVERKRLIQQFISVTIIFIGVALLSLSD